MSESGRLAGRVAVVTGAAQGMGAAHARALVADGATVVLADILDQSGTALVDELGDAARYVHLDVTDPDQWRDAVSATVSDWGSVDVLVNNAGIVNGALLQDFALSEWQRIMDINVTGTFLGMQAVTRTMIEQKSGSIVRRYGFSTTATTRPPKADLRCLEDPVRPARRNRDPLTGPASRPDRLPRRLNPLRLARRITELQGRLIALAKDETDRIRDELETTLPATHIGIKTHNAG